VIRRTKIVATLGPATGTAAQIAALLEAGVNVVRINASHGTPEIRGKWIDLVRRAAEAQDQPIAVLVPDLAVEVISKRNTPGEMRRKLRDYFLSGVRLVWLIYPKTQTAEVYRAPDRKKRVGKTGSLDGEDVLPGFRLPLSELFARARRRPSKPPQQGPRRQGE